MLADFWQRRMDCCTFGLLYARGRHGKYLEVGDRTTMPDTRVPRPRSLVRLRALLKGAAEAVGGLLLAVMFGAFLLQVFMRYVINRPLEWTLEVCLIAYLWFVFWSLAFLLNEREHIAFGLLYDQAAPPVRRVLAIISVALIASLLLAALPGTYDFIRFMAIDRSWVLHLRFDLVFSVFLLFMVAVIVRSLRRLGRLLGRDWRDAL